jgi:hypothetical protein
MGRSGGSTYNPAYGGFPGRTFPILTLYELETSASLSPKVICIVNILPLSIAERQCHFHRSSHRQLILVGEADL